MAKAQRGAHIFRTAAVPLGAPRGRSTGLVIIMEHIKTNTYACYHYYHNYPHSRERGEEAGNQNEEEQKTVHQRFPTFFVVVPPSKKVISGVPPPDFFSLKFSLVLV